MNRLTTRIRQPVQRGNAEGFLLITLLSFAASVIITRLFLILTGYPQLAGGGFHIGHVLWGGLLLFIAAQGGSVLPAGDLGSLPGSEWQCCWASCSPN
jgi:hypothetical protein